MAFRYPIILFLYAPLIILFFVSVFRKNTILEDSSPELKHRLLSLYDSGKAAWKRRLFFLGLIFLVLAASGPQVGTRMAPIERKGVDLVFAIDVSSSMNGEDVKPNRLEKAKIEISQIIRQLKGDRVSFIVFAGVSHLYLPLTTDYEAARLFLDAIDTDMITTQGTDLSSALKTGLSAFSEESQKFKVMVLITDGEDHEGKAIDLAQSAAKSGLIIHTVGVGTSSGSLIPMEEYQGTREYKRDGSGKLVTSILNEDILIKIAKAGQGVYVQFDNRPANYQGIIEAIDAMEKRTLQAHLYSEYEDRFQLVGFLALLSMVASLLMPTRKTKEENWRGRFVR